MDCVICCNPIKPLLHPTTGEVVWEHGNNAEPVALGRCCDDCNWKVVMPKRFDAALGKHHGLDAETIRKQIDASREHDVALGDSSDLLPATPFEGHGHAGLTDQELYDHENPPPLEDPMDWEK